MTKIRHFSYIPILCVALLTGCTVHKDLPERKSYRHVPARTSYCPNYRPVSKDVIARLPSKIERLPVTQSMSGSDFLGALDLEDFSRNIKGSVRFNSHFMQLDADHVLQIRCNPDSLIITGGSIDHILNPTSQNPTKSHFALQKIEVVGCTLRKNWDEVISYRWLQESKAEPGS